MTALCGTPRGTACRLLPCRRWQGKASDAVNEKALRFLLQRALAEMDEKVVQEAVEKKEVEEKGGFDG